MNSLDSTALPALDAATVMVLRQSGTEFEVFMVRRHHKSGFMANAYVYPGGKLDEDDCTSIAASHVLGLDPEQAGARLGDTADPMRALGLFLAGVRETFEEAGILLASRRGEEDYIDLTSDAAIAARFADHRQALHRGELSLCELAAREDLVINLENVGYFAHWITPYFENRRFDTRFFVAIAPPLQRPLHDALETTDSLWITPSRAIDRYRADELFLAPPTLRTLEQLAGFEDLKSLLDFSQTHR
ncbi:MAG: NUDIX hydrolase, partial [Bradymonadaceae bacterium]